MEEKNSDYPNILKRIGEKKIGGEVSPDSPKVSVIIPAYNIAPFIEETLDSVFEQTFQDFEVIVVNDGSADTAALKTALEPYFDKIIYAEQSNSGASKARNAAICLARGGLLAFLDGDDIWLPDFLASQINFLEKNDFEMVYCDALIFGEPLYENRTFMQNAPSNGAVTTLKLLSAECSVITSGTVIRKAALEKFGLFDGEISRMEDFDLWFRLAKNGVRIGYQTKVLLKYRMHAGSISGTNVERAERSIAALNVIGRKYDLSEAETKIWKDRMILYEAAAEIEKGKMCLAKGDYAKAKSHFSTANKFYRTPKLVLVNFLMRCSPHLTGRLFKKMRPSEFAFILPPSPTNNDR